MKVFVGYLWFSLCTVFSGCRNAVQQKVYGEDKYTFLRTGVLEGWFDFSLAAQERKISLRRTATVENEADPQTLSSMEAKPLSLLTA